MPIDPNTLVDTPSTDEQISQRLGGIKLIVNGHECNQWDDINIDSDIGIPADGLSFAWLDMDIANLPDDIKSGAVCQISYQATPKDENTQAPEQSLMIGVIDRIQQTITRGQLAVVISGRDLAGQLLDTSVPIMQAQNMTLEEILQQFVFGGDLSSLPWRVIPQDVNWLKAKTGVQDGESVWDAINKAAESSGQYVWMSSDGALCIGNPFNVSQPYPVRLVFHKQSEHNIIDQLAYSEDLSNAYSLVEVVGQDDKGKNFRGTATDDRLNIKRRKIISDTRAENQSEAMQYAQKALRDSWLNAYECTINIPDWVFFDLGWRLTLESDVVPRSTGEWVVYGRTMKLSRDAGKTTELRLRKYAEWMQPVQHVELVKDTKAKSRKKKQVTVKSKRGAK